MVGMYQKPRETGNSHSGCVLPCQVALVNVLVFKCEHGTEHHTYLEELLRKHVVVPLDLLLQAFFVNLGLFAAARLGNVIPIFVYICHCVY